MDMRQLQAWLDGYVRAWKDNDRAAAGRLFAEDARYYANPWDEGLRGRAAIEAEWAAETDPPETFEAEYRAQLVTDDLCVATGQTVYRDTEKFPGGAEYHNAFLLRFNQAGEATEYREWYMRRPADE